MYKRKLSLILVIAMIISMMPVGAFALSDEAQESSQAAEVAPKNCWADSSNTKYYDKNGNLLKDTVAKINGKLYYFNKNGVVTTYTDKWKKVGNDKYYFNAKGKIVIKPTYVKNKKGKKVLYMFAENGKLLIKKKGIFKYKGKEYYSLGDGKLKTGWAAVKKQAMYFNPKTSETGTIGSMAKGVTVGHLKVPKNGRLGEAYALGVKQLDKSGWTLWKAYKFSYKITYRDRWYRRDTTEKYAIRGFKRGNGNCYVMASTFFVMGKLLGYDITRVSGKVAYRAPHSWTVIKEDGKEYVYDPNFRNETGRSGWRIWYGKKGTWRYTNYSKVKSKY